MSQVINGITITSSHIVVRDIIYAWSRQAGFCWASNRSIAEHAGLSTSYVSHIVTDLHRAGLVGRKLTFSKRKEFLCRQLVAFKKALGLGEADKKIEEQEEKNRAKGQRNRLIRNGRLVNLAPTVIIKAVAKFGEKAVDHALAIVRASNTVANPYAYFCKALKDGWKAGKRAAKLIGSEFVGGVKTCGQKAVKSNPNVDKQARDNAIMVAQIKQAEAHKVKQGRIEIKDDYLRETLKKRTGKSYVEI